MNGRGGGGQRCGNSQEPSTPAIGSLEGPPGDRRAGRSSGTLLARGPPTDARHLRSRHRESVLHLRFSIGTSAAAETATPTAGAETAARPPRTGRRSRRRRACWSIASIGRGSEPGRRGLRRPTLSPRGSPRGGAPPFSTTAPPGRSLGGAGSPGRNIVRGRLRARAEEGAVRGRPAPAPGPPPPRPARAAPPPSPSSSSPLLVKIGGGAPRGEPRAVPALCGKR
jgi:hypothetical protein